MFVSLENFYLDCLKLPLCLGTGLGKKRMQWFCCVPTDMDLLPALSMPSFGKPPYLLMLYKGKSQTPWLLLSVFISIPTCQPFYSSRNRKPYSQTCSSNIYAMYLWLSTQGPGAARPWTLILDMTEAILITLIKSSNLLYNIYIIHNL